MAEDRSYPVEILSTYISDIILWLTSFTFPARVIHTLNKNGRGFPHQTSHKVGGA